MMTTLQKRSEFSMKMAKSLPFMDQFSPNHHRISFFVRMKRSVTSKWENKRKYIEETRSKSIFCHDDHAPKTAKIQYENGQISAVYGLISSKPPQNVLFYSYWLLFEIKIKKLKKLGLKSFFVMMPTLKKGQNLAWKWRNLCYLWTNFLQTTT